MIDNIAKLLNIAVSAAGSFPVTSFAKSANPPIAAANLITGLPPAIKKTVINNNENAFSGLILFSMAIFSTEGTAVTIMAMFSIDFILIFV